MSDSENMLQGRWALILGASSGFGAATARALAREGVNIFGVHLDSRSTLDRAKAVVADIESSGAQAIFFNTNAADARRRTRVLTRIKEVLVDDSYPVIHIMVHTLAFGSLRKYIADDELTATTEEQMDMTLRVMAHSLVYWTQDLMRDNLLGAGSRIYSMSSMGSQRATASYGAVSAAKAALEAHTRQLALELAPHGISANCFGDNVTQLQKEKT